MFLCEYLNFLFITILGIKINEKLLNKLDFFSKKFVKISSIQRVTKNLSCRNLKKKLYINFIFKHKNNVLFYAFILPF